MKDYQVALEVTHVYVVDVEANNDDEAREVASQLWWDGQVEWTMPNDTYLADAKIRQPIS